MTGTLLVDDLDIAGRQSPESSQTAEQLKMAQALSDMLNPFLEHLRTVHFALLASCLVLFASTLPEPPEDLKLAKRDLERIQSALDSKSLPKLIERAFILGARGPGTWKSSGKGTYASRLTYKQKSIMFRVTAVLRGQSVVPVEELALPGIASNMRLVDSCGTIIRADLRSNDFRILLTPQSSLAEFGKFWDCLPDLRAVKPSKVHYEKAAATPLDPELAKAFANNFIKMEPVVASWEEARDIVTKRGFSALFFALNADGRLTLQFDPSLDDPVTAVKDFGATPKKYVEMDEQSQPNALSLDETTATTVFTMPIVVPLSTSASGIKAQKLIIDEFFPGVGEGSFERRFPQLASWSRGRQSRAPGILIEDIQREIERASESFEVFGVKIPMALIAKMGLLVILAIEAYLCLHMRRLSVLLKTVNSMPEFPWIGVYSDNVSKSIFATTLVGVPLAVSAMLLYHSWNALPIGTIMILGLVTFAMKLFLIDQLAKFWDAFPRAISTGEPPSSEGGC